MRNSGIRFLIVFLILSIILGSIYFKIKTSESSAIDINSFEIVILDFSLFSIMPGIGNTIDTSWPVLKEAYPSKAIYSIKGEDIEQYDWDTQTITLTQEATTSLSQAFDDCDDINLAACLGGFPYVVVLDHQPIYGGLLLIDMPFAEAFDFPVMYVYPHDNQVAFAIRPHHSVWIPYSESEWQIIKDERIRKYFIEASIPTD